MPWCPKCRKGYAEGVIRCSDCDEELEQIIEVKDEVVKEVLLIAVANDIEADIYKALLESFNIPIRKRYAGAGDYLKVYMGNTNLGVDLYVSEELYDDAMEIINSESDIPETEDIDMAALEEDYRNKRRLKTWLIILFFIPGAIWILCSSALLVMRLIGG